MSVEIQTCRRRSVHCSSCSLSMYSMDIGTADHPYISALWLCLRSTITYTLYSLHQVVAVRRLDEVRVLVQHLKIAKESIISITSK